MKEESIGPNTRVVLDYVLKDRDGTVLDQGGTDGEGPIDYVHGYGMLVPGLEAGLVGLRAGEQKVITVSPEEGFGDRDDDLLMEVDPEDFPEPAKIKAGDEFVAQSPDGDEVPMRVVEVRKESVLVDANHPLAGKELFYAVKILEVRAATPDEIAEAAAELEAAESHVHGPECEHGDHLVRLGKKTEKLLN